MAAVFFRPKNSAALIEDPFLLHTFIICSCAIILPIILVLTFVYVSEVIFRFILFVLTYLLPFISKRKKLGTVNKNSSLTSC